MIYLVITVDCFKYTLFYINEIDDYFIEIYKALFHHCRQLNDYMCIKTYSTVKSYS